LEEGRSMAKIVFKFFEVIVKDDDVVPFVKEMEEVLKKFAGEAYLFRYYLEEPESPNTARPKTQKNGSKGHNLHGGRTNRL
jgi:hypothetical protein